MKAIQYLHRHFWHCLLIGLCLGWVTLPQGTLKAQPIFSKGTVQPAHPRLNQWFWEQPQSVLYRFDGAQWQRHASLKILSVDTCHGYLLIESHKGHQLLMTVDGKSVSSALADIQCFENGFLVHDRTYEVVDTNLGRAWLFENIGRCPTYLSMVQGIPCICRSSGDSVLTAQRFDCGVWRAWGMWGMNGKWLIPPNFDIPFYFDHGLALVSYQGQKRKINEKGEFVE